MWVIILPRKSAKLNPCGTRTANGHTAAGCFLTDNIMRKSEFFTFLAEHIVAIHILQGIDAVRARSHTFYDEVMPRSQKFFSSASASCSFCT